MGFKRLIIQDSGLSRNMRQGDNWDNPVISTVAADAAATITAAQVAGGVVMYTSFSAGRVLTTDTGANFALAFPEMDIGDSVGFTVSSIAAFAGTFAAGVGVTLAGRATCPASSAVTCYLTRTGAATFTWTVL
jgi:hypothetical protein